MTRVRIAALTSSMNRLVLSHALNGNMRRPRRNHVHAGPSWNGWTMELTRNTSTNGSSANHVGGVNSEGSERERSGAMIDDVIPAGDGKFADDPNAHDYRDRSPASAGSLVRCTLCGFESEDCIHLRLYVVGSEGVQCCLNCRAALAATARGIMHAASVARKIGYKAARQVAKAKAENGQMRNGGEADNE